MYFQEDIEDEDVDDVPVNREQSITDLFDVVISNPTPASISDKTTYL